MPLGRPRKHIEAAKIAIAKVAEDAIAQAEAKEERLPGKLVNGQKTPWTYKDQERVYGICTFTPEETIPVTISGVTVQLIADVQITCPCCFRDIYLEHRRKMRQTGRSLAAMGVQVLGQGPLTEEPTP